MTVIIDDFKNDTSLFRNCCINERLCLVYFIHRPRGIEGEIMLPVLFDNVCDTRRFYMEYHYAIYNNDSQYVFIGKAHFSKDLYNRISQ